MCTSIFQHWWGRSKLLNYLSMFSFPHIVNAVCWRLHTVQYFFNHLIHVTYQILSTTSLQHCIMCFEPNALHWLCIMLCYFEIILIPTWSLKMYTSLYHYDFNTMKWSFIVYGTTSKWSLYKSCARSGFLLNKNKPCLYAFVTFYCFLIVALIIKQNIQSDHVASLVNSLNSLLACKGEVSPASPQFPLGAVCRILNCSLDIVTVGPNWLEFLHNGKCTA